MFQLVAEIDQQDFFGSPEIKPSSMGSLKSLKGDRLCLYEFINLMLARSGNVRGLIVDKPSWSASIS